MLLVGIVQWWPTLAGVGSRALHWVPIPMSTYAHGFWVGMGAMLLFISGRGHGWAWVRYYCSWVGIGFVHPCIQLQIGVKLLDAGNTLTKKHSGLKPTTMNDLLFVRSNQDLV